MIERIGNCRILEEIGSGGMAVIFKAVQESLNRTVAVKALKTSVAADESFVMRFEREAKSMAALQHENILQIYDFQKAQGAYFIVMEFVEGIDLYDLLERQPVLPIDVAAIIAMQVARALDFAHYRDIVHRDIKPANIMIAKSGGVKLMDFGIARDKSFGDLTEAGTGLGTPSYMSPEQILGEKLDPRTDVFSLGIVLYQMVCGRKPFVDDPDRTVMQKIRLDRFPSPRRLNPLVPWELERILARCMQKKREDRYRSTQDLVVALERFIARRCEINYHARIVEYLRAQSLVSEEEAERYIHPAGAGHFQKVRAEQPVVGQGLKRLLAIQGLTLGGMALAASFVHLAPIGMPPAQAQVQAIQTGRPQAALPVPIAPPGFVRVVVDPWAEIYVDGTLVDTTPLARPLPLAEGKHRLELRNPFFAPSARELVVQRGTTQTVKVALAKR